MLAPAASPVSAVPDPSARSSPLLLLGLVTASWLALFLARLLSPSDLLANDQERAASYVMDVVHNGNWICQRDSRGDVTSKPPMFTWLAATATAAFGRINRFTLCFPSALATLLLSWLLLAAGARAFGRGAGTWGALAFLLCESHRKQVLLARTDPLFGFTVFLALMLGHRAWTRGRGWTGFWLAAAAATLTKGPLGLLLAGGGVLLAQVWERRSGERVPLRGTHIPGVLSYLAITLGWLGLASWSLGGAVLERLIGRELLGHSVLPKGDSHPGEAFYLPALYFLATFLPWSLVACAGFWRVAKRPAGAPEARRFERVLFSFFFVGLLALSLASHQRRDLVFPLIPAAALLCGREIASRIPPRSARAFRLALLGIPSTMLAVLVGYQFAGYNRTSVVRETGWTKEFARRIEETVGRSFPLAHVKAPFAVQIYLDTFRRNLSLERAIELLEGPETAFVAVREGSLEPEDLRRLEGAAKHEVARGPEGPRPFLRVLGNHPRLEASPSAALVTGDLYLRYENLRLVEDGEGGFVLAPTGGDYAFHVTNEGSDPRGVTVEIATGEEREGEERTLRPGETWSARGRAPSSLANPRSRSARGLLAPSAFVLAAIGAAAFFAERTRRALASTERW